MFPRKMDAKNANKNLKFLYLKSIFEFPLLDKLLILTWKIERDRER